MSCKAAAVAKTSSRLICPRATSPILLRTSLGQETTGTIQRQRINSFSPWDTQLTLRAGKLRSAMTILRRGGTLPPLLLPATSIYLHADVVPDDASTRHLVLACSNTEQLRLRKVCAACKYQENRRQIPCKI